MSRGFSNRSNRRYLLLTVTVLMVALVGYGGFIQYTRLSAPTAANSGLILLAMAAGMASLFSPCSFPLLVTLLAEEAVTQSEQSLMRSAAAFSVGAMLFLLLVGLILAIGAGSAISSITFASSPGRLMRLIVGVTLVSFGAWQVHGKSLNFTWLNESLQPLWKQQARLRHNKNNLRYGLHGFGYILAGFGWTGPILAGLALHAVTIGSGKAALYAFGTAALTIALVMIPLVIAIGFAKTNVLRSMKTNTQTVKRLGGAVLIFVGAWLIILAIWANVFIRLLFV